MTGRQLVVFFLLAFGITWGIAGGGILLGIELGQAPLRHPLFFLAVYGPALAALAVVAWSGGAAGLRGYAARLVRWRAPGRVALAVLLGLPASFALARWLGAGEDASPALPTTIGWTAALGVALTELVLDPGPVEELGWRGLALPELQRRLGDLRASLLLGLLWGVWHLPAFWLSDLPQQHAYLFGGFVVGCMVVSILMTAVFNATGGSILWAFLFHWSLNDPLGLGKQAAPVAWFALIAVVALALVVRRECLRPQLARAAATGLAIAILALPFGPARATASPDPPRLEALLRAELQSILERDRIPGMLAAVALPDGRVVEVALGSADPERGVAMTLEHRSMSGSIGKSFVAATALALAHDGIWNLDAPVATWLGDEPWFDRLPNAAQLTPRVLLKHAGGLDDHVEDHRWAFVVRVLWRMLTEGADAYLTPEEAIGLVLDRPPRFAAGAGFHYTDTGYLVLGLALERAAGRPYDELLCERFLRPLGLSRTAPAVGRDLPGLVAGHQHHVPLLPRRVVDAVGRLRFDPAVEWTGGGLITHPGDLVRWAKHLYEGRALSAPYLDELLANPSPVEEGLAYGLGVYVRDTTPLGPRWGHGGFFPGYRAQMQYYPEHGLAVALQLNRDAGVEPLAYAQQLAELVVRHLDAGAARAVGAFGGNRPGAARGSSLPRGGGELALQAATSSTPTARF